MRTELVFRGVKPAPLFSPRDNTLREMLAKLKVAESHQLMATLAASLGDHERANESNSKLRDAVWYTAVVEDRNARMSAEYHDKYKDLTPELYTGVDGKPTVRGLT